MKKLNEHSYSQIRMYDSFESISNRISLFNINFVRILHVSEVFLLKNQHCLNIDFFKLKLFQMDVSYFPCYKNISFTLEILAEKWRRISCEYWYIIRKM